MFGGHFDIDGKKLKLDELAKKMNDPNFWNDRNEANNLINEVTSLKKETNDISSLKKDILERLEIANMLKDEMDEELRKSLEEDYPLIKKRLENISLELLLNGKYDHNDCILEIHSGAGGTEACDWAMMLYRMYQRYLSKNNYKYEEIDMQPGEEVGIKSVTILVHGNNAYGYLKGEKGIHRLVRISPFDSNKRRHTSFASVDIVPEIKQNIDIVLNDNDLKIDVYHSSGAGGQSVNTTDSAVRITHIPTKTVVTCQNERSQTQNKEKALEILKSKLYNMELEKQNNAINEMKSNTSINFGSGKRSYIMCPYTLVKDNDTLYEASDIYGVLDGNLNDFIERSLKGSKSEK